MKIQCTSESKQILKLSEISTVKQIIKDFKDNGDDLSHYLETLSNIFHATETIKSTAKIAKNSRIQNVYTDDSKDIDIWIDATLFSSHDNTFYIVGAYLSDIWESTGDNDDALKSHMYIRKFVENK